METTTAISQTPQTIIPSEHEKREWSRLAQSAYANDRNDIGHTFSMASGCCLIGQSITLARFDYLQSIYRRWLIDGFSTL